MNSFEIMSEIEMISNISSKNGKIEILSECLEDDDFRLMVTMAYSPHITFGVNALPSVSGSENFDAGTLSILNQLASRELSGGNAKNAITAEFERLNKESVELFSRIANKDLKAGFNVKSINSARAGTIQEFPYMRCSSSTSVNPSSLNWAAGVFSQRKADGLFTTLRTAEDGIEMLTRQGQPLNPDRFEKIRDEAMRNLIHGYDYHGELNIEVDGKILPRSISNGLINSVLKGGILKPNEIPIYSVWDAVPTIAIKPKGRYPVGYAERFFKLERMLLGDSIRLIETSILHSHVAAENHFKELYARGEEGTIWKDPGAEWRDGVSTSIIKRKGVNECSLRALELVPGKGKNADTFGSILCVSEEGDLAVQVSGFTDADRAEIYKNWNKYQYKVMDVKYTSTILNSKTNAWSLFEPRYIEFRIDKDEADSIEKILCTKS